MVGADILEINVVSNLHTVSFNGAGIVLLEGHSKLAMFFKKFGKSCFIRFSIKSERLPTSQILSVSESVVIFAMSAPMSSNFF